MKKLLLKIGGLAALGALMIYNVQASKTNENNVTLSSVVNTASAQSENPWIEACDSWCYHSGYVCWLKLSNGGDLYCYGWDEPF